MKKLMMAMTMGLLVLWAGNALAAYWGDCVQYSGSPNGIVCTKVSTNAFYRIGYVVTASTNRIVTCRSTDESTWTLAGWADNKMGGVNIPSLYIVGTSSAEKLTIQQTAANLGTNCNFSNFPSQFTTALEIYGEGGADTVEGSQYNDTLLEGEVVIVYGGNDHISLSSDGLVSGYAYYYAHGGTGNDTIYGSNSTTVADWIIGWTGNDNLYGQSGDDRMWGGDGNDYLNGGPGSDIIFGGNGDDTLYGMGGRDFLYGDLGNDYLNGTYPGLDPDGVIDMLYGEDGDDSLETGQGDDVLVEDVGACDGEGNRALPYAGDGCLTTCPSSNVNCEY
jgi:Ca2+-binding RTX toxin-like protein